MAQKLSDQLPQTGQLKHLSPRTENAYVQLPPIIAGSYLKNLRSMW